MTFSVTVSASISKIPIADAVTRVINIRSKQPYDIYIGNLRYHPQKYPQTKWGNPYAKFMKKLGRDDVIDTYSFSRKNSRMFPLNS